jgi:hypothetical protein
MMLGWGGILTSRSSLTHDDVMRTTVRLEPEVERAIRERAHRARRPFTEVLNELLRRALRGDRSTGEPRFRVVPHKSRLVAGVDAGRFNQLADEIEDEELAARMTKR